MKDRKIVSKLWFILKLFLYSDFRVLRGGTGQPLHTYVRTYIRVCVHTLELKLNQYTYTLRNLVPGNSKLT